MTINDRQQAPPNQPMMETRKAPDFRSIYANWVQASHTPFDISLTIGEATATGIQRFEVEQKARVVFSPVEAKIVLYMLVGTIKGFEEAFGDIVVPPGLVAPQQETSEE